ncbi:MAG: hypothetical protein JSS99_16800 [Actinobacteria bacterium]|nr:hypothetical protein [Actinomycetota bacterium]
MSTTEFEARLRAALHPVEPPEDFAVRLERGLVELHEMATDELEAWELSAMRDPRNWARPAAAAVVGTSAGAALFVLRARARHRRRRAQSANVLDLAERTVRELADEARRLLPGGD